VSSEDPTSKFWAKVKKTRGCWNWTGSKTGDGYGRFRVDGNEVMAARFAYEQEHGEIEDGLRIGRSCENPSCVRPSHLYAATPREITLRGIGPTSNNAQKTMCKHGHELTGYNLYVAPGSGQRKCRTCMQERAKVRALRFKGPKKPKPGKVVLRIQLEDHTAVELAEEYGVSDTTIRNWAKAYGLR
jgi:hypothetical protein